MDSSIYREQIIDLYEHPLNFGELDPHDFSYEEDNPLCGDVVRIDVVLDEDENVADVKAEVPAAEGFAGRDPGVVARGAQHLLEADAGHHRIIASAQQHQRRPHPVDHVSDAGSGHEARDVFETELGVPGPGPPLPEQAEPSPAGLPQEDGQVVTL